MGEKYLKYHSLHQQIRQVTPSSRDEIHSSLQRKSHIQSQGTVHAGAHSLLTLKTTVGSLTPQTPPHIFPLLSEHAHISLSALALQLSHLFSIKGVHTVELQ